MFLENDWTMRAYSWLALRNWHLVRRDWSPWAWPGRHVSFWAPLCLESYFIEQISSAQAPPKCLPTYKMWIFCILSQWLREGLKYLINKQLFWQSLHSYSNNHFEWLWVNWENIEVSREKLANTQGIGHLVRVCWKTNALGNVFSWALLQAKMIHKFLLFSYIHPHFFPDHSIIFFPDWSSKNKATAPFHRLMFILISHHLSLHTKCLTSHTLYISTTENTSSPEWDCRRRAVIFFLIQTYDRNLLVKSV